MQIIKRIDKLYNE